MRSVMVVGLAIAMAGSCKKEASAPGASAPASTTEQDALWTLAPEGMRFGMVASPRGVAMVERAALAVEGLLDTAPELAELRDELQQALTRSGAQRLSLAELGLTGDKGFAVFVGEHKQNVTVLPVADRDKFLAKLHGKKGNDSDELDGSTCKTIDGRYICAASAELFGKLGHSGLTATLRLAGARGDIELAGHDFTGPSDPRVAVVAQLDRGAAIVRGVVAGVPAQLTDVIGAPIRPREGSSSAAGFGTFDLSPFLAKLPDMPIAPNVTFGDLKKAVPGQVTFAIPGGTKDFGLRIPLTNPAPVKALLEHCAELGPLASVTATLNNGVCHVEIPQLKLLFDGWVEGNELRIGDRAAVNPVALAPSAFAEELARGEWAIAFFGRGSFLDLSAATVASQIPPEGKIVLRALPMLSEIGFGLRRNGADLHFMVGLRTAWSNPDDVVQKLLAISADDVASGKAAATGASIASAAPNSPFAQDFKAGIGGMLGVAMPIGAVTSIAIPAFVDYTKRSKAAREQKPEKAPD